MAKIDLHIHSKYSEHPSDWFLQRIGAQESYTDPEFIYEMAKERGMDLVTITDHNKIDGAVILKQKYPYDTIIGVETTTYFPEDECKIHILLYGITEAQFDEIQKYRKNIYTLREYIQSEDLAYSVAHATYSINGKLNIDHIEKLLLLFDVFEGINGGRNIFSNFNFMEIVRRLTPEHYGRLVEKHQIETMGDTPWIKGFTAGSDDHSGMFIAKTHTLTEGQTQKDAIESIKRKKTVPCGRHNDYKSLAFTVYKIAYDFSKTKKAIYTNSLLDQLNENIFETRTFNLKDKLKIHKMKTITKKNGNRIAQLLIELIEEVRSIKPSLVDERLEIVYEKTAAIADEFFKKVLTSVEKDIVRGDVVNLIMNISSSIPGLFLSLPFFSAQKHMFQSRALINDFQTRMGIDLNQGKKKILWFTDTINDLNGVSETLKELGWITFRKDHPIKIVTADSENHKNNQLPPNIILLPVFFRTKIPSYEDYVLHFPSVLRSINILQKEEPTEIYISTPGPIGLLGLLAARLFNIKCSGIYHTDFKAEVEKISSDRALTDLFEAYTRWFYSMMNSIKVHSKEYIELLAGRGLDQKRLHFLPKGIDPDLFNYKKNGRNVLKEKYGVDGGISLLYAGRVSKDKDLEFLTEVYKKLIERNKSVNLLIVGKGPYQKELKEKTKNLERVFFTGRIEREDLPEIYSAVDLFVFPSSTDTFGMVVMEAQACELPAVVSDIGGPKEIIVDGVTGLIAKSNDLDDWMKKIEKIIEMKTGDDTNFSRMKKAARQNVIRRYSWNSVINGILEDQSSS